MNFFFFSCSRVHNFFSVQVCLKDIVFKIHPPPKKSNGPPLKLAKITQSLRLPCQLYSNRLESPIRNRLTSTRPTDKQKIRKRLRERSQPLSESCLLNCHNHETNRTSHLETVDGVSHYLESDMLNVEVSGLIGG